MLTKLKYKILNRRAPEPRILLSFTINPTLQITLAAFTIIGLKAYLALDRPMGKTFRFVS
jgi:hypothetical protein